MVVRVKLLLPRCGICGRSPDTHGGAWQPQAVDDHPHPYVPAEYALVQSFAGCRDLAHGEAKARDMFRFARVLGSTDVTA